MLTVALADADRRLGVRGRRRRRATPPAGAYSSAAPSGSSASTRRRRWSWRERSDPADATTTYPDAGGHGLRAARRRNDRHAALARRAATPGSSRARRARGRDRRRPRTVRSRSRSRTVGRRHGRAQRGTTTVPATAAVTALSGTVTQLTLSPLDARDAREPLPTRRHPQRRRSTSCSATPLRFWPLRAIPTPSPSRDVFLPGRRVGLVVGRGRTHDREGRVQAGHRDRRRRSRRRAARVLLDATRRAARRSRRRSARRVAGRRSTSPSRRPRPTPTTVARLGLDAGPGDADHGRSSRRRSARPSRFRPRPPRADRHDRRRCRRRRSRSTAILSAPARSPTSPPRCRRPSAPRCPARRPFARARGPGAVVRRARRRARRRRATRSRFGASANDPATVVALGLDPRARAGSSTACCRRRSAARTGGVRRRRVRVAIGVDPPADRSSTVAIAGAVQSLAAALIARRPGGLDARVHATTTGIARAAAAARRTSRARSSASRSISTRRSRSTPPRRCCSATSRRRATARRSATRSSATATRRSAFQRFALKKKPVTYVPGAAPGRRRLVAARCSSTACSGRECRRSTAPAPHDEVYVTRIADDGTLTVQFGDGDHRRARCRADGRTSSRRYRQGIGLAGRVGAGEAHDAARPPDRREERRQPARGRRRRRSGDAGHARARPRPAPCAPSAARSRCATSRTRRSWPARWRRPARPGCGTASAARSISPSPRQGGATFSADGLDAHRRHAGDRARPEPQAADRQLRAGRRARSTRRSSSTPATCTATCWPRRARPLLDALSFDQRRFAAAGLPQRRLSRCCRTSTGVVAVDVDRARPQEHRPGVPRRARRRRRAAASRSRAC